jgi:hypothetical protein
MAIGIEEFPIGKFVIIIGTAGEYYPIAIPAAMAGNNPQRQVLVNE